MKKWLFVGIGIFLVVLVAFIFIKINLINHGENLHPNNLNSSSKNKVDENSTGEIDHCSNRTIKDVTVTCLQEIVEEESVETCSIHIVGDSEEKYRVSYSKPGNSESTWIDEGTGKELPIKNITRIKVSPGYLVQLEGKGYSHYACDTPNVTLSRQEFNFM